ncbi:cell death activator CIDE-A isoform X2 [Bos indicus x Bos taurus]|uniref:cell death activator CIDE-A isoform X2 n=1 Tax=Bos indicus x Bos taurus TaxID=30522 RepID=UPI000F7D565A|nr:cell death activator CIDE-A isoform X2 [Bos indicus x Bos taurus]
MSLGAGRGRKRRSRNSGSRASCASHVSPGTEAEVRRQMSGDSALGAGSARPGWQRANGGQSPRVQAALDSVGRVSPSEGSGPLTFMGSQTKKVLFTPLMHPARPFRVSNHDRSSRRGVMASSLQELLSKTLDALVVASQLVTLVLEEDGTVVDTEEFFQTLGDNTHLMVLEQGQKWTPEPAAIPLSRCPGDWPVSYPHGHLHAPSAGRNRGAGGAWLAPLERDQERVGGTPGRSASFDPAGPSRG